MTLMPKRKERVAPPPASGGWDFPIRDAIKGWEQIFLEDPANARTGSEWITVDPRQ